jgi:tetratricopeptide (TPR) repeat protein
LPINYQSLMLASAIATAAEIAALTRAEGSADDRIAAAAALLERGVAQARALDRAMDRLAQLGLDRPRRTDSPRIWAAYGAELARLGEAESAQVALDLALSLDPELASAHLDRAALAFQAGDLATARTHFATAAELAPDNAAGHEGLASVAARDGDSTGARRHAGVALARNPASGPATLAIARAELLDGETVRALERVTAALETSAAPDATVPLLDIAAEALEALGRHSEAFAAWARRNRRLAARVPPLPLGTERPAHRAARIATWLETRPPRAEPPPPPPGSPVFLVGFPRSGTTLLEKALAGHPAIRTLEELEIAERIASPLLAPGAIDALPDLPSGTTEAARTAWHSEVAAALAPDPLPPLLIDKMPLSTVLLPALAQIWPGARILLAVRDPRDVVLSCFRRRFRLNPAMAEFLDLQNAATFYGNVQRIAACTDRLALNVTVVRHEALVADFEGELGQLLAVLGLEWDEGVRDFAARASARAVTPSDMQLRRGLSADGIGAWRAYAADLAPVRPLLDRWAVRLGYSPD